jgi:hypothetical protein
MSNNECEFCGARLQIILVSSGYNGQKKSGLWKKQCTSGCSESRFYFPFPDYIPVDQRQRYVDTMEKISRKKKN